MKDNIIHAEVYKDKMKKVLKHHGLSAEHLHFVEKLPNKYIAMTPNRCSQLGVALAYKPGMAIYFKCEFKRDCVEGTLSAIVSRGFSEAQVDCLRNNDWHFLKHVLLHEICHIVHPYVGDPECNRWAFDQLDK